jgi:predicted nucleic acid-binding protein
MIVVDAMVIAYGLLPHPQFVAEVERVRDRDAAWAAPPLWRSELRSTLLQYVCSEDPDIVRSDLTLDDAVAVMHSAESVLGARTMDVDSEAVLALADASGCSAYDGEYVALAEDLDVPLVTYDRRLQAAFPDRAVAPTKFAA